MYNSSNGSVESLEEFPELGDEPVPVPREIAPKAADAARLPMVQKKVTEAGMRGLDHCMLLCLPSSAYKSSSDVHELLMLYFRQT
jgi:hypothetical protein